MKLRDSGFVHQSIEKYLAKACRMGRRQADIFVEVKHFDSSPIDIRETR